jgi:hypothetical protein
MYWLKSILIAVLVASLAACQTPSVQEQTAALTLSSKSLSERQLQSRRFDTKDEKFVLSACAGVLQDLGFNIDESSAATGLLVASKDRDAVEAGQVAGQVFLSLLSAAVGVQHDPVWEKNQKIRISIVSKPLADEKTLVRVTFQRVIWNTRGVISRVESIGDPKLYREFFDKLSQSVFLEANQI